MSDPIEDRIKYHIGDAGMRAQVAASQASHDRWMRRKVQYERELEWYLSLHASAPKAPTQPERAGERKAMEAQKGGE